MPRKYMNAQQMSEQEAEQRYYEWALDLYARMSRNPRLLALITIGIDGRSVNELTLNDMCDIMLSALEIYKSETSGETPSE